MQKSIKINSLLNSVRMMLTVLVPLITFPYTSRIFLSEGSGKLNFSSSFVSIFVLFASLGVYTYGVREGSKVRNDRIKFSLFGNELLLINICSTFFTYIVFFAIILLVPSLKEYRILLFINSFTIGFNALGMDWVYGVYEDYLYITIRQIIIQLFIIICMFLFVHDARDIFIWASLSVISGCGSNLFNFFHARKYIDYKIVFTNDIRKHLKPIFVLFATQLASKVYNNLDTIFLGFMASDRNTGIYSAAVKVNTILITCFTAMMPVFVPRIITYLQNKESEDYHIFLKKIFGIVMCLGIPVVIGLEFIAQYCIVLLAGDDFYAAGITMRILTPIILVTTLSNVLYYNVLVPMGHENKVLKCTIIGAVLNAILTAILIPSLKENGAAIGSLISEIAALCVAYRESKKVDHDINTGFANVKAYLIGGVGIIAVCLGVHFLNLFSYIINMALMIIFSFISYFIIITVMKDPVAEEILIILKRKLRVKK